MVYKDTLASPFNLRLAPLFVPSFGSAFSASGSDPNPIKSPCPLSARINGSELSHCRSLPPRFVHFYQLHHFPRLNAETSRFQLHLLGPYNSTVASQKISDEREIEFKDEGILAALVVGLDAWRRKVPQRRILSSAIHGHFQCFVRRRR